MSNFIKQMPKVYVLDNGRMKMDKNFMISMHNPATIDNPNKPAELIEFPIFTVLIDHPDGKVLFDTACNPNSMGENGRWPKEIQDMFHYTAMVNGQDCHLHSRLAEIGVDPRDIDYVVVSHLHLDHSGCLELFTNAKIIVHQNEFNAALSNYAQNRTAEGFIWDDVDAWIKNDLTWRVVKEAEGDLDLLDGIRILNFGGGHSYGMLGLHIELPGHGPLILASDAVYSAENYSNPSRLPATIYDSLGYMRTVERIQKLSKQTGSDVWFGHDSEQFNSLIKSTDGFYE
ncbi:N-acyl homoserine lactonase family protein [Pseudomonas benzenivorans]|uniref:N-acyl homoserine lactonase family protein n=1 Tax=Pseudomonas benzenivorans TaxID=556533 RepID=A0ABY5H6Z3_9PSED|nr:N-acyl homoserine lactonase family protein [Pseudomonas benzenivorans]UTW08086.1 N-acyl homoserine lactonase family protein [Pseudomonas benzenivorans]